MSLRQLFGHHRDGAYAALVFVILASGVFLASITWTAHADTPCQSGLGLGSISSQSGCTGSYTVYAVVAGARPSSPAIITSPKTGQTFDNNPVQVEGTCPDKAMIKIFSNGILVGSVLCQAGHFKLPVDLLIGRNDLTALPFNAADEQGPTSPTVTVTLNEPVGGLGFSTELVLQSENYYRGTEPGMEITWPIEIVGGQAPYAVTVDWGDGSQPDLITRLAPGPFTVKHTYKKPGGYLGSYPLIIRATDAAGHTAYLQLTTIVNAPNSSTQKGAPQSFNKLLVIWPLWIVVLLMALSFWLGERREKHIMRKQLEALA